MRQRMEQSAASGDWDERMVNGGRTDAAPKIALWPLDLRLASSAQYSRHSFPSRGGAHFGAKSMITCRCPRRSNEVRIWSESFGWASASHVGFRTLLIENPRVGGSIPALATIQRLEPNCIASRHRVLNRESAWFMAAPPRSIPVSVNV
jgi:hypothetical protein